MGLERVVSIIQDAPTNFETDLFMPIIHAVEALGTNVKYGDAPQTDVSFKVIADHIRALSFALVMVRFLQMKVVAMCYVVYYVVR